MDVFVVGGHGKIALRFERLAAQAGHWVRAMIRNPDQSGDIEDVGAEAIVTDIESDDITRLVDGADVVVFAAGAGPGSGPERKKTVDLGGAIKLIDAAKANGVSRYLMVSAMGVGNRSSWAGQMRPYYEAKAGADEALISSGLDYTIVRPGSLTNDPGTGLVDIAPKLERRGQVPRDDVAAVLLESIDATNTVGKAFDLLSGQTPIPEAVRAV
jgi:uncharacterized protein YbjT (DUF2867 family)